MLRNKKEVPEEQPKLETKEDEETITLTKAELEEIKKTKICRGSKKGNKNSSKSRS